MLYVLEGLEHGFRVGFAHGSTLHAAPSNMQSARLHPAAISSYLSKEVDGRRMSGPFLPGQIPGLHINRMGVVLKGQHPWPMETDHRSLQHGGWKRKRWYRGPAVLAQVHISGVRGNRSPTAGQRCIRGCCPARPDYAGTPGSHHPCHAYVWFRTGNALAPGASRSLHPISGGYAPRLDRLRAMRSAYSGPPPLSVFRLL